MGRTFSNKIRVRGEHKRAARNQGRPRISQTRVPAHNMPVTIIHKQWLEDGTQVAIAQVNNSFICAQFDERECLIGEAIEFKYGGARQQARDWVNKMARVTRGF
tara:strand:- start:449 stop:760 length:312 start_codon:yes stop_codon:yes gene_type:complete